VQISTATIAELDPVMVLAPERYDPRRRPGNPSRVGLLDVAMLIRETITAGSAGPRSKYLVLDTGDAHSGLITTHKAPVSRDHIGSTKKVVSPGDVVVSRLRPYLRQVALIDHDLADEGTVILCSTEFYVLRSRDGTSIAFLVPLLLSPLVQGVLVAAQEGGHHPRFPESTLEYLGVPDEILEARDRLSEGVEESIAWARRSQRQMRDLIHRCGAQASIPLSG
jgi:hypothetical protein